MTSQQDIAQPQAAASAPGGSTSAGRTLVVAGAAHALHDGYTDLIYVLLPVWQAEFGLSIAMLAMLRGLYTGTMAALQLPSGWLAEKLDGRIILAIGTALAAGGYAFAEFTRSLIGLCAALAVSGAGSSTQHPISSAAVSRAFGASSRSPLGTYNFTGDLGKAAIPALTSLLLILMPWRGALWLLAALGAAVAATVILLMPPIARAVRSQSLPTKVGRGRGGFWLLFAIGVLDTGVRMGLLTFLPFLLKAKGASLPTVGIVLAMIFLGGAAGKFVCGWLGARVGVLLTVLATEGGTAACIVGVLVLPLVPLFMLLPLLGVMLNGTSSVLYGTVPDLMPPEKAEHAFALFYTGTIGSGALSPVLYGVLSDRVGPHWATALVALAEWMMRFVEHRVGDQRLLRLIRKWLTAGVVEDGERQRATKGTPQGAVISPLLAKIYLHYAYDLWVHRWRRRHPAGAVIVVRYADDTVVGFEHRCEAERFLAELRDRMAEFGLERHPDKARLIAFGRKAAEDRAARGEGKPQTFDFLGFTHICSRSQQGRFLLARHTRRDRKRAKLLDIAEDPRRRWHQDVAEQGAWLGSVVRGYFAYHAVPTNSRALSAFRHHVVDLWRRALRRRSQKDRTSWADMDRLADRWLPMPRISHPWPAQRLRVRYPRWEPYAGMPPVRFCAGGAQ